MSIDEMARSRVEPKTIARAPQRSRSATVLALQARALSHRHVTASATAVATELALLLGCERVSVGFRQRGGVQVCALSNAADIRGQQNLLRAIAAAMEEALDQGSLVVHPLPRGKTLSVSLAHAELARVSGSASICTVPIAVRGSAAGAIVFERRDGFDARAVELVKDAATFVGPVLALQQRLDLPFGARLVAAMTSRRRGGPLRVAGWQLVGVVIALGIGAASLWPFPFRVIAPARVEAAGQRVIAAPVDGFVQTVGLRPGEPVRAGQVLATLEDRDLALEREKWGAEIAQLDKQYRETLTKDDAAQIVIARSKLEQAQIQNDLVVRQLERARLIAPFDGVLIAGDLSQSVGMPVKRGQELMTVAPERSFRIVAEVDEQDVGALREGQRAWVLFAALPGDPLAITVTRIAPVSTPLKGSNVFEVDGVIDGSGEALRPGLRGIARIHIAQRSLGWIWWHRTTDWSRRTLWRVFG